MDKMLLNRCRSWMLRAENLAVVRECRRLVQREFGVTLHIHDEALLEKICGFGARSKDRKLQRLILPIERLMMYGLIGREFTDMDLSAIPTPVKSVH
jgi:hypothetical protein